MEKPSESEAVLAELAKRGLLLMHDQALTSATSIIAAAPVKGSWWSHPLANEMYRVITDVEAHRDVVAVKLVRGKVTFVHRRLWPALLAIARAREPWQLDGLSADAGKLLKKIDDGQAPKAHGKAVKELETRLLARSEQVHTEAGKHAVRLEAWSSWARRMRCKPCAISEARRTLEEAVAAIGGKRGLFPWS